MIQVCINGLTVAGNTQAEFLFALSQVGAVAEAAKANGAQVASVQSAQAKRPVFIPFDYAQAWADKHGKRFRMSGDEANTYGNDDKGRQAAARARLMDEGEDVESMDAQNAQGIGSATQAAGVGNSGEAEVDESLVSEFD